MKLLNYILATVLIVALSAIPAFAEEVVAVAATTTAEFGALIAYLIPIITVILGALGLLAARYLLKKIGLEGIITDEALKKQIDKLAEDAAAYGVAKVGKANWTKVETKSKILGYAINYANDHGPDLLTKAGFDATKIKQKLEAKLNSYDPTTANPAPAVITEVK